MLKLRLAPLAAIGLSAAIAFAQEPAPDTTPQPDAPKVETSAPSDATPAPAKRAPIRRKRKPVAVATPVPVATPAPKKPGFWERVFGKPKPRPTPAPATPKPTTPKPVVKKTATKKTATKNTPATDTKPDTERPGVTNVEPIKPVDVKPPTPKPPTGKSSKTKGGSAKVENFPPPPEGSDPEVLEKHKYDQAKAKAASDPKIQELRGKADLAATEDESRKALRDYNKAMFRRMKEIDPSIKDRVDRMEAAVMSRLGE